MKDLMGEKVSLVNDILYTKDFRVLIRLCDEPYVSMHSYQVSSL